jgi:hypothetical protein
VSIRRRWQQVIEEAQQGGFWGVVELSFQNGDVVLVRKTEAIKIVKGTTREAEEIVEHQRR